MNIDWDDKKRLFVITCPFHANDLVLTLPSRTWSKPRRAWIAKPIRQNVEKLVEFSYLTGCTVTAAAKKALDAATTKAANKEATKILRTEAFPAWYKFKSKQPRKHQRECFTKMYGRPAFAIHADMGTGKTFMLINEACALRMEGKIDAILVVVKLSGRMTWVEQIDEHAPIPILYHLPSTDNPRAFDAWLHEKHDFKCLIVGSESLSQGSMPKFIDRFMAVHNKIYMAADESHLFSNHKSIRTEVVIEDGLQAKVRRTATGTPIKQNPMDLYAQMDFLDPDILGIGDFLAFRNRYAVMGGYREKNPKTGLYGPPKEIVGYQNLDELVKIVAPYVFECLKSEVLDLPPKIYHKRVVQMTKEQRVLYDAIKKFDAYTVKGHDEHVIKNALEKTLRLHQVAGGFSTTYIETERVARDGSIKIKRTPEWHPIIPWKRNPKILEVVDLARDDVQFIFWAAYLPEIQAIVNALEDAYPKERIVQIHGAISEGDRETYRQQYQKGSVKYMVGNTATGGQSSTWTACGTMVYYNNTQKLIDRLQSEDRAHRDGLTHTVNYVDIIMEGTVDELNILSIAEKMDLAMYIRKHIREVGALIGNPLAQGA